MAGDGDERPAELRIGRWLPPSPPGSNRSAEDAAVTELIPVVTEPLRGDPVDRPASVVSPRDADPQRPADTGVRRWRAAACVAVATTVTVAAAAVAPMLLDRFGGRPAPFRQTLPTIAPTGSPPTTGTPTTGTATPGTAPAVPATTAPGSPSPGARPEPTRPANRSGRPTAPDLTAQAPSAASGLDSQWDTFSVSFEAEGAAAVRGGRAGPRQVAGASGGTVITRIGGGSANLVRFTKVGVPAAGRYTVTFHYVGAESRPAVITANGQPAAHQFPATGRNPESVGAFSLRLSLARGQNTIVFAGGPAPAPDLDRIVVSGPPA